MNTKLSQLRAFASQENIPIISQNTEFFLKKYITTHNIQHIIEIWTAIGYSTSILIESIEHHWSILSWEISYPHYYQAIQNTRNYSWVKIMLWNFCHYPLERYIQSWYYDMVFIDGRKSETLEYLKILSPYLQTTTHIIIDDVIKFKSKMIDFYNFLDMNDIFYTIEHLDEDDGILIIPQSQHLIQVLSSL